MLLWLLPTSSVPSKGPEDARNAVRLQAGDVVLVWLVQKCWFDFTLGQVTQMCAQGQDESPERCSFLNDPALSIESMNWIDLTKSGEAITNAIDMGISKLGDAKVDVEGIRMTQRCP